KAPPAVKPGSVFAREEALFVLAVLVGSVAGLAAGQILVRWMSGATAGNAALAVATTVTAATHARLVHRRPHGSRLPSAALGALGAAVRPRSARRRLRPRRPGGSAPPRPPSPCPRPAPLRR